MIAQKKTWQSWSAIAHRTLKKCMVACVLFASGFVLAQENVIESITANQQGSNVIVKIALKNPVTKPPIGFSITSPARIALDFASTANAMGKSTQELGLGDVRNVNVVQAGDRSRLVFNLSRPLSYATTIENNAVIVTIDGSGGTATAVSSSGLPVAPKVATLTGKQAIRDIDFRRLPQCSRYRNRGPHPYRTETGNEGSHHHLYLASYFNHSRLRSHHFDGSRTDCRVRNS